MLKRKTETARDKIIVKAFLKLDLVSVFAAPSTTGKKVNMHGAKTVSTPAINEVKNKIKLNSLILGLIHLLRWKDCKDHSIYLVHYLLYRLVLTYVVLLHHILYASPVPSRNRL